MKTKLDAIKWALAHLDEIYMIGNKEYRIVGAGFNGYKWVVIGKGTIGWNKIDFDDCILSDLSEDEFNNFNYININRIWEQGKKV